MAPERGGLYHGGNTKSKALVGSPSVRTVEKTRRGKPKVCRWLVSVTWKIRGQPTPPKEARSNRPGTGEKKYREKSKKKKI